MPIRTRAELKALFENGDQPDADAFIDLIDSFCHMAEALPAVDGAAVTGISPSEWTPVGVAPTYVNQTSFSVPGELTETFLPRRRTRMTLSPGGIVTSAVRAASYAAGPDETTVEIDDPVLTVNLTAVSVSLLTPHESGGSISLPMIGPLSTATITGLELSNNGLSPTTDIDVAPGYARDTGDSDDIFLTTVMTKSLAAVWAPGSGAGGLLAGARTTNSLYAVWLIKRTDTGHVDVGIDPSFIAPSLPANYDKKRLIGFITTNTTGAGEIRAFLQAGDHFAFIDTAAGYDHTESPAVSGTTYTATLLLPPNSLADVLWVYQNPTSTGLAVDVYLAPVGAIGAYTIISSLTSGSAVKRLAGPAQVLLDSNAQCDIAVTWSTGSAQLNILAQGCTMLTRSSP